MSSVSVNPTTMTVTIVFTASEFALLASSSGDLQNLITGYLAQAQASKDITTRNAVKTFMESATSDQLAKINTFINSGI